MQPAHLVKRFPLLLILGISALPFFSAHAANTESLSQEQALAAARGYVLADEEGAEPHALVEYEVVTLDPKTWGRGYFAFRFPRRGSSQYYVGKTNGFVSPALTVSGMMVTGSVANQTDQQSVRSLLRLVEYAVPTITKEERWTDYAITVTFSESLAGTSEDVGLRCVLWAPSENSPPYHLQEHKSIFHLRRANTVGALTFYVTKIDAERFPTLDICLVSRTSGTHWSPKIADIPTP